MSDLIQTPYGPKTPELLCKAMDAYELLAEVLPFIEASYLDHAEPERQDKRLHANNAKAIFEIQEKIRAIVNPE